MPVRPFVIAIGNGATGTGKSLTAANLAFDFAEQGVRTLLIDLDPLGVATVSAGVDPPQFDQPSIHAMYRAGGTQLDRALRESPWPHLSVVPADMSFDISEARGDTTLLDFAVRQISIARHYGVVVVDTPSSYDLLLMSALGAADALIIPCTPQQSALDGIHDMMTVLFRLALVQAVSLEHIAILPMMFNAKTIKHRALLRQTSALYGDVPVLEGIRQDPRLAEALEARKPIRAFDPRAKAAEDFSSLGATLFERWLKPAGITVLAKTRPVVEQTPVGTLKNLYRKYALSAA